MKKVMFCLLGVLMVGMGNAELLVHEDFEAMNAGSSPSGQTPGVGIDSWFVNSGAKATVSDSASFGSYVTGSQAMRFDKISTSTYRAQFNMNSGLGVSSGSMYMSFLFEGISPTEPGSADYLQWRTGAGNFRTGVLSGAGGIETSIYGTEYGADNSDTLMGNGMFMVITKFDGIGTAAGSSEMWVINAAAYDSIIGDGVTEAELDAVAFMQAASSSVTSVTLPDSENFRFYLGDPATALVDEIKLGTTLADVTAIPEPTTLCLLGMASLGGLLRRRG